MNITEGLYRGLLSTVENAVYYMPEPIAQGTSFVASLAKAGGDTTTIDVSPEYQELINRQIETQLELQQVTFISNIERSEHESRMAAVRNFRVA